ATPCAPLPPCARLPRFSDSEAVTLAAGSHINLASAVCGDNSQPPEVTYLSPSTPVSAEDSGPTQLTRVELGGEVQAKRRQSRCANQPPSEVSSVFGASAASASMAKRAAASAQSGAAPGSGGPSAAVRGAKKDKLFQHLLN
ncbi:unnamed protein product, partial [Prorocentrum cordatum]